MARVRQLDRTANAAARPDQPRLVAASFGHGPHHADLQQAGSRISSLDGGWP